MTGEVNELFDLTRKFVAGVEDCNIDEAKAFYPDKNLKDMGPVAGKLMADAIDV